MFPLVSPNLLFKQQYRFRVSLQIQKAVLFMGKKEKGKTKTKKRTETKTKKNRSECKQQNIIADSNLLISKPNYHSNC